MPNDLSGILLTIYTCPKTAGRLSLTKQTMRK